MRVFVTGATGWIGSAVVPELLAAGHQVLGLARSDTSAQSLVAAGAQVHRGDLQDLDALRAGAAACDGVVHLAFGHDFTRYEASSRDDQRAIEALGDGLLEPGGSGRPLVIASGFLGLPTGRPATERDVDDPATAGPRLAGAQAALGLAERGVRSVVVRLAPTVHGAGDPGFVTALVGVARSTGVSGYVGDGDAHWPAVHRQDAARLFRLALEQAPAGSVLHAAADQGVATRVIAEVLGRQLGLPARSVPVERAEEHFGWLAPMLARDVTASSALTRQLLGWQPTCPGLLEDLEQGHYTRTADV